MHTQFRSSSFIAGFIQDAGSPDEHYKYARPTLEDI
jgi:hypothetical protein